MFNHTSLENKQCSSILQPQNTSLSKVAGRELSLGFSITGNIKSYNFSAFITTSPVWSKAHIHWLSSTLWYQCTITLVQSTMRKRRCQPKCRRTALCHMRRFVFCDFHVTNLAWIRYTFLRSEDSTTIHSNVICSKTWYHCYYCYSRRQEFDFSLCWHCISKEMCLHEAIYSLCIGTLHANPETHTILHR